MPNRLLSLLVRYTTANYPIHMQRLRYLCFVSIFCCTSAWAQSPILQGQVNGSFQTDVQYLFPDSIIGAEAVDERLLSNTFFQLTYQKGNFRAGMRYEAFLNPLLGYDRRYEGQGIPYRFASYDSDKLDFTVGNIYDQFGNGIVFRAYRAWALGIDNSVDGLRIKWDPVPGVSVKGIIGKQRRFFELSDGLLRGGDAEIALNELLPLWQEKPTRLTLGASFMNRFLEDDDARLILPENVSAVSGRARLNTGKLNLEAEYAYKINDPFQQNNYVYNPGEAIYVNGSYANPKGWGANFGARRVDNFDFRSERTTTLQELTLSFLPPSTRLHTYRLATLYPYATQLNGEVGWQGSLFYRIPAKTKLGGKYGTRIEVNYSRLHGLDTTLVEQGFRYNASFLGDPSKLYFQDINVSINRKWNRNLRTILTYIYLQYNKDIIEFASPLAGFGIVNTHIGVLEAQYRIKRGLSLRMEAQHMYTQQDLGSWAMLLAELSISPHWFFTVFDEYNYGNPDPNLRVHYYNFQITYAFEAHRIALSYARQRRGLLCVGGICREVPAANGINLSITSSF